jgi:hypothetical protein
MIYGIPRWLRQHHGPRSSKPPRQAVSRPMTLRGERVRLVFRCPPGPLPCGPNSGPGSPIKGWREGLCPVGAPGWPLTDPWQFTILHFDPGWETACLTN